MNDGSATELTTWRVKYETDKQLLPTSTKHYPYLISQSTVGICGQAFWGWSERAG